ncbi:two-component system, chemotaxis family, response regulator CheB [Sphingomonas sp. OV641]|uniref:protein-glutamate methylesterase/protein-glutamine glutaminase n=1 Tax=Sphingomonas sp. OV641 TaxID=1881068 RepID=UPI0008C602DB|nr:chemotaxis response regulator protein-glutamate methylesterase [Sphingomonas sp. OV641]SEI79172.1 two-component system, chemotaxis family, response regulator CheB [Sphingomonas sp. OV641]
MTARVRTLIVDDSASMRAALNRILSADPEIEVVGLAPEPHTARAMIKELSPDVITLDVEMPGMDGLSFLERIMRLRPMPVVMCSTLTARGAEVTIEALRLGAVDCVAKPSGNPLEIVRAAELLCATVKAAARSAVRPIGRQVSNSQDNRSAGASLRDVIIAIGASTGGVEALFSLLSALPADCSPVLVVQHMPAMFTGSFAARLDRECRVRVIEAVDGQPIHRGTVYIAPGGERHMELAGGIDGRIKLRRGDPITGHRPSVDVLFRSVAPLGDAAIGIILTGMGADGAEGLRAMRDAGARTLGQSRESCVVYGMPRAAFGLGAVQKELSLSAMPEAILAACRK